nr:ATP-binding protein [uncultured Catonella sp.]
MKDILSVKTAIVKKRTLKQIVHSLFFIMFRNYALVVVAFAILTGLIFVQLYSRSAIEANQKLLLKQAESIAKRVGVFVDDDDYITYPSFLEVLEELETTDIWIIANPKSPMPKKYTNIDISKETQAEISSLFNTVFSGKSDAMDIYSETYGANYIFTAVPITTTKSKDIIGAVFVNQISESQKIVISRSFTIIIISTLIALLFSLIFAVFLARRLSKPLSVMRATALRLADEDYEAHTEINEEGELGELAGAIDSLSDRLRQADEARKNLEQMRLDFFANVSHELRTPITVVRAYSETLLDGIIDDEATKFEYYDKMLTECKSMERLVGDLLVLSKMQNPDFTLEKEPINLVQVFSDILRSGSALARAKGVKINVNTDDDILLMYGDYDRIRQMFMVIVDNAIKFSNDNGNVDISVKKETAKENVEFFSSTFAGDTYVNSGNNLLINIRDNGVGIADTELPHIFEKFYKSKLRQNAKGSGLGLAIARQIAIKHGGSIVVESKKGEGTEFKFEFAEIKSIEL